jgi:hypothetical protein
MKRIYCTLCNDTGYCEEGYGVVGKCRGPTHMAGEIRRLADQNPDNPDVQRLTTRAQELLHQYCGDDDMVPLPWIADEERQWLWSAMIRALVKAKKIINS